MNKILVIDDDTRLRNLLGKFLADNGFETTLAKDAKDAALEMDKTSFDVIVIDVMMPGISGMEFTKNLRLRGLSIPVLMLTAMSDVEDRIEGLESGADDYLSKPFEPKELLLRINNILRRNNNISPFDSNAICRFGEFVFNFEDLRLRKGEQFIHITGSEGNILKVLCQNIGKKISRDELSRSCSDIDHRSIDVQITRLRRKIEDNPKQPIFLQSVRGYGYVLKS